MGVDIVARGLAGKGSLPSVTSADNGQVLGVVDGAWDKTEGMSLIDRASVDGSVYTESGDFPYYELPVLCVFDKDHKDSTAFTTNPAVIMPAIYGVPDNDIPMLLSAAVFAKGDLPGVKADSSITYRNNQADMGIWFSIGGDSYYMHFTIACDFESATPSFIISDVFYSCNDGNITETAFYDVVERMIVYLSATNSEFILPINTTYTFPMLNATQASASDIEMDYQQILFDISTVPFAKIFDCNTNVTYTPVADSEGNIYGISLKADGGTKRLSFEEWEDPEGNTRYIKISDVGSSMALIVNEDQNVDAVIPANTALMCTGSPEQLYVTLGAPEAERSTEYRLTFRPGANFDFQVDVPDGFELTIAGDPITSFEQGTLYEFSFAVDDDATIVCFYKAIASSGGGE